MATIQWRPEVNALTTPPSWRPRFNSPQRAWLLGKADGQGFAQYSEEEFRTFIDLHNQFIAESLINGEQVTEENNFTYSLSFTGKLDSPEDPLPPLDECLQVRVHASPPFIAAIRQAAKTERLPLEKKLPLIATAQDTVLGLKDALNPAGLLQLNGSVTGDSGRDPAHLGGPRPAACLVRHGAEAGPFSAKNAAAVSMRA